MPIPVIVGVGQVRNKLEKDVTEDGLLNVEDLMFKAIELAWKDFISQCPKNSKLSTIDEIHVVATWTMPFQNKDLPERLMSRLKSKSTRATLTSHGGNSPVKALDLACQRVKSGDSKIVLVVGGEALQTLSQMIKGKVGMPKGAQPNRRELGNGTSDLLRQHGCFMPIHCYPLMENARGYSLGKNPREYIEESATLYGEFEKIGVKAPCSWNEGRLPLTKQDLIAFSKTNPKNRMISFPYPLLQCAFNTVNLASCVIVASNDFLVEKPVYPIGASGASDTDSMMDRSRFDVSPSLNHVLSESLKQTRGRIVDKWDIYSCFPIVPKFAGDVIKKPAKELTLLGGLTTFGGAGNNYSLHAVVAMVKHLRGTKNVGVVVANGGNATHHHAIVLCGEPLGDYVWSEVVKISNGPPVKDTLEFGKIVTYTIVYDKRSKPEYGVVIIEGEGYRSIANVIDSVGIERLSSLDVSPIGSFGKVKRIDSRNIFVFE